MSEFRRRKLDEAGFLWQAPTPVDLWNTKYDALVQFAQEFHHCCPEAKYQNDNGLKLGNIMEVSVGPDADGIERDFFVPGAKNAGGLCLCEDIWGTRISRGNIELRLLFVHPVVSMILQPPHAPVPSR